MKRYAPGEIIDGKVKMVEREDGDFVLAVRHEQAIAAAVHAERRRVWDVVSARMRQSWWNAERLDTLNMLMNELFPDGEPKTEDTLGEDEIHTCGTCGRRMDIVRPGKWQCPKCEDT